MALRWDQTNGDLTEMRESLAKITMAIERLQGIEFHMQQLW